MTAKSLPNSFEMNGLEILGFDLFWTDNKLDLQSAEEIQRGWWLAHRRAFAQGVVASLVCDDDGEQGMLNPYDPFSAAGEAWGAGFEEEPEL